jgi:hypothetical protein
MFGDFIHPLRIFVFRTTVTKRNSMKNMDNFDFEDYVALRNMKKWSEENEEQTMNPASILDHVTGINIKNKTYFCNFYPTRIESQLSAKKVVRVSRFIKEYNLLTLLIFRRHKLRP